VTGLKSCKPWFEPRDAGINLGHDAEIQMASGDTIRVHNGSPSNTFIANVTFI